MAYVYILKSSQKGKYYIGSTVDINRRIKEHKQRKHLSSKRLANLELVFKQEFNDINTARKIEYKLKSYKRRDFIEKIIRDGFIRKTGP